MCISNENNEREQSPSPSEKQYLDRISKLERLVDIQEQQKDHLRQRISELQNSVKELMSR
jgi:phosphoglycerate-specific signal transduction histidine kinase